MLSDPRGREVAEAVAEVVTGAMKDESIASLPVVVRRRSRQLDGDKAERLVDAELVVGRRSRQLEGVKLERLVDAGLVVFGLR